jgi:hypothetical protein
MWWEREGKKQKQKNPLFSVKQAMLFRRFSGVKGLINASTYGYNHDEVVQESKPNEWNSVVDTNCNQVTPAILKTLGRK